MDMTARATIDAEDKALFESKLNKYEIEREQKLAAIMEDWAPMLKGMPDRNRPERNARVSSAHMYQNTYNSLVYGMTEETRTVNVGPFQKYIFPVLRRVVPNMIAHELVSVQTINAPIAAIFYLDFLYGSNKGSTVAGNVFPRDFDRNYSSTYVKAEPIGTGNGVDFGVANPGGGNVLGINLAYYPVRPLNTERGWKVVLQEINAVTAAVVQTVTDNGTGGFTSSPAGATGTINYSNGAISNFRFGNTPAAGNFLRAFYFYDNELSSKLPQVQLDIKKAGVEVENRKLKAVWSIESMEDLKALHGTEAEAEMVANTSASILLEVDREILDQLFQASLASGITDTFDCIPPAAIPEIDHIRSIIRKLSNVSNEIHRQTLRAPANWMVCSTATGSVIEQLTTHHDYRPIWVTGDPQGNAMDMPRPMLQHGQFGVYKFGTLQNKWVVYIDPFAPRDFITLGLKGASYLDSGAVFAPYVPLEVSNTLHDPDNFGLRKGFRMRYAFKITRQQYYGNVRMLNLSA